MKTLNTVASNVTTSTVKGNVKMKSIRGIIAVESTVLENAVEVIFHLNGDICNIQVTEDLKIGQVMSKYFGQDIRLHPVARNQKGHMVSVKGIETDILEAALKSGVFNVQPEIQEVEEDFEELSIEPVCEIFLEAEVKPTVSTIIIDNKVKTSTPIKRNRGSQAISKGEVIVTPVVVQAVEPIVEQFDTQPEQYVNTNQNLPTDEELDIMYNQYQDIDFTTHCDFVLEQQESNMLDMYPDTQDIVVPEYEQEGSSELAIVRMASRVFYDYFIDQMRINTINRNQLLKQFEIIWNKNAHLHAHKALLKCYIFDAIKQAFSDKLGKRIFLQRDIFNVLIKDVLVNAVHIAQQQAA